MLVYRGQDPNRIMEERVLSGAAYPGQAVVRTTSSKFIAASKANSIYAILTDKSNKFAGDTLEGAYSDGDWVEGFIPQVGDKIEMVLALDQTITLDMELALDANGYLAESDDGAEELGDTTDYVTFTPLLGRMVTVAFVDPSATSQSLAVTITGSHISVSLKTGGGNAIESTPAEIVTAVENVAGYDSLVSVAATGDGVVTADTAILDADEVFAIADEAVATTSALDTIKATVARNQ